MLGVIGAATSFKVIVATATIQEAFVNISLRTSSSYWPVAEAVAEALASGRMPSRRQVQQQVQQQHCTRMHSHAPVITAWLGER